MARSSSEDNFLQPIFSAFGLIASVLSAVAPLFAQAQLQGFFVAPELSLPSSVVSVILGVLLSWQFVSMNGFIDIPIGIKRNRGRGYDEPWKSIRDRGLITIILILCFVIFMAFFWLKGMDGYVFGLLQAGLYVLFFTLLIGAFSLLFISAKRTHEYQQQAANTGRIVFETLEKNGVVKSGIEILHNSSSVSPDELAQAGLAGEYNVKRLVVKTVPQTQAMLTVYTTHDYTRLIAALPVPASSTSSAETTKAE